MDDFAYLCRTNAAGGLHSICEDTTIFAYLLTKHILYGRR